MIETANLPPVAPANGTAGWDYLPRAGLHDELLADGHQPRPHWNGFLQALTALGLPELTRRWDEARQLIHENGVTYNVYGDPRGMERPWQLDPIPVLISSADVAVLEAGLVQRGRLLEALLHDLYGPQQALAQGHLPPELVYANPGFFGC